MSCVGQAKIVLSSAGKEQVIILLAVVGFRCKILGKSLYCVAHISYRPFLSSIHCNFPSEVKFKVIFFKDNIKHTTHLIADTVIRFAVVP